MNLVLTRVLPPAGYPMTLSAWSRALRANADALDAFQNALEARLQVGGSLLVSSGRAALSLGLRALADRSPRKVVVIPAYACYTVPASVVRAGLRVRLCDVDPQTLDLDPDALRTALREDVLAVVAAGLYGLPADVESVRAAARAVGSYVVDDAAQCFGGEISGRPCGSQGDFGITSFSKGKGLSTFEGGALLSSKAEIVERARGLLASERSRPYGSASVALLSAGFALFQRPRLYGLVHRIPMLGIGRSTFDPGFGAGPLTRFQGVLGVEALARADEMILARRVRADRYRRALDGVAGIELPRLHAEAVAAWTRFPVMIDNEVKRTAILARLAETGLGASASYPQALTQLAALAPHLADRVAACPGAERVARGIVTLPTHPAVRPEDQTRIGEILAAGTDLQAV